MTECIVEPVPHDSRNLCHSFLHLLVNLALKTEVQLFKDFLFPIVPNADNEGKTELLAVETIQTPEGSEFLFIKAG